MFWLSLPMQVVTLVAAHLKHLIAIVTSEGISAAAWRKRKSRSKASVEVLALALEKSNAHQRAQYALLDRDEQLLRREKSKDQKTEKAATLNLNPQYCFCCFMRTKSHCGLFHPSVLMPSDIPVIHGQRGNEILCRDRRCTKQFTHPDCLVACVIGEREWIDFDNGRISRPRHSRPPYHWGVTNFIRWNTWGEKHQSWIDVAKIDRSVLLGQSSYSSPEALKIRHYLVRNVVDSYRDPKSPCAKNMDCAQWGAVESLFVCVVCPAPPMTKKDFLEHVTTARHKGFHSSVVTPADWKEAEQMAAHSAMLWMEACSAACLVRNCKRFWNWKTSIVLLCHPGSDHSSNEHNPLRYLVENVAISLFEQLKETEEEDEQEEEIPAESKQMLPLTTAELALSIFRAPPIWQSDEQAVIWMTNKFLSHFCAPPVWLSEKTVQLWLSTKFVPLRDVCGSGRGASSGGSSDNKSAQENEEEEKEEEDGRGEEEEDEWQKWQRWSQQEFYEEERHEWLEYKNGKFDEAFTKAVTSILFLDKAKALMKRAETVRSGGIKQFVKIVVMLVEGAKMIAKEMASEVKKYPFPPGFTQDDFVLGFQGWGEPFGERKGGLAWEWEEGKDGGMGGDLSWKMGGAAMATFTDTISIDSIAKFDKKTAMDICHGRKISALQRNICPLPSSFCDGCSNSCMGFYKFPRFFKRKCGRRGNGDTVNFCPNLKHQNYVAPSSQKCCKICENSIKVPLCNHCTERQFCCIEGDRWRDIDIITDIEPIALIDEDDVASAHHVCTRDNEAEDRGPVTASCSTITISKMTCNLVQQMELSSGKVKS